MLRLTFALDDPALRAMAEIVHEIDLQMDVMSEPEIAGLEAILTAGTNDLADAEREAHGIALFEGLYQTLASNAHGCCAEETEV